MSYAAGKPDFGNLLNPMLREIDPDLAKQLHDKYKLPLDYRGRSFQDVSTLSDHQIYTTMKNQLGDEL
ncbi:MAG: hypothetical protein ACXWR0_12735 [Bdellovibrio sp.]